MPNARQAPLEGTNFSQSDRSRPLPWMVAMTLPRAAFAFSDELYSIGFETYAPAIRERTVHRGKKSWKETPLLGGYVLVRYSVRWPEIFKIEDSRGMIMDADGDAPRPVPHSEVQFIKGLEVKGVVPANARRRFKEGDRVAIGVGPWANLLGDYGGHDEESGKSTVLLSLLGGTRRVKVPDAILEAA